MDIEYIKKYLFKLNSICLFNLILNISKDSLISNQSDYSYEYIHKRIDICKHENYKISGSRFFIEGLHIIFSKLSELDNFEFAIDELTDYNYIMISETENMNYFIIPTSEFINSIRKDNLKRILYELN